MWMWMMMRMRGVEALEKEVKGLLRKMVEETR